jgi:hypothetical protein
MNFEDGELSFNDDSVEAFFLWFIFVSDRNSLEEIELMKSNDSVSEDFSDLACRLSGITRGLEDNDVELFLKEKGGGVGDVSSDSGNSLNSDFILWGFFGLFSDLEVFIGSSCVRV